MNRQLENRPSAGFTLIELIASIVMAGLLLSVAGLGVIQAAKGYLLAGQNTHMTQKAHLAMSRLSRELRELTTIETYQTSGSVPVPYLIYKRIDETTGTLKRMAMARDGNRVKLYELTDVVTDLPTSATGDVLVDGLDSGAGGFALVFYKGDYPEQAWAVSTDKMEDLKRIQLTLTLARSDLDMGTSQAMDFVTVVCPRNR